MNSLPKLLIVGDGAVPTGIARVIHNIINNPPDNSFDIHHLALGYNGDPHIFKWKLYPAASGGDLYGFNRIKDLVNKIEPDIVFTLGDLWIQKEYLTRLNNISKKFKIVTYTPVDSGPVDPEWLQDIGIVDKFVVYTNFAKSEILKALGKESDDKIEIIPHGVDSKVFYPLPGGIEQAKKTLKVCPEEQIDGSFVVLNANRNQPRKRIDITIHGFAEFAKDKPDNVYLYLHMGFEDAGWNVLKLAKRFGISDRLILTSNDNQIPGVSDECLNLIYNACDVGLNTSASEGWGLPSFEHAAVGRAQIVPHCYSLAEIWNECAEFVEPYIELSYEGILTSCSFVHASGVAKALDNLYHDADHRNRVAKACYDMASRQEFSWENIAISWGLLFKNILD